MDDNIKLIIEKIKAEKNSKNKNLDENINLEIELVKIKYSNNPNKLQNALKEFKKKFTLLIKIYMRLNKKH